MAATSETPLELRRLPGDVVLPGDAGYDAARAVWNASIDRRPAAIVRCRRPADVVAAVRFARAHDLPIAVRGGGHNVAGLAVCDGGVVIDLSGLRGAVVDPHRRIARVQPGATWGDLDAATQRHALAAPGGLVSMTGVAGFTLGGGLGWLTRRYGPACDCLLGAEVVTADGEVVAADAELLWGLRGGGGNFGVVTRFDLRLHPVGPIVLAGPRAYPLDRRPDVLDAFRAITASASEELATLLVVRHAPPAPWLPPAVHGRPVAMLVLCATGARRVPAALDELGPPLADALREQPYVEFQRLFDAGSQPGLHNYWKAEYLDGLRDLPAHFTSSLSDIKVLHLGGAMARGEESAFGHRDARFVLNVNARWRDPAESERHIAWAREAWLRMRPCSAGGTYVNFLGDEGHDRVRAAYGDATYARLVALKRRYDPDNAFRVNQNIDPS
jgi:FAD/FMN-containing dehydrogenase